MKVESRLGVVAIGLAACLGHTATAWGSDAWDATGGVAFGAHEHGVADLTVAIDGQAVELVLAAPSADLFGLERPAATEQERASVRERVAALEAGDWFVWGGGQCERVAVEVTLPAVLDMSLTSGEAVDLSHDEHEHDHDHDGHRHHDHADDDPEHVDGMVEWQYRCEAGVHLRHLDVGLFDLLALQRIRAGVVSERGQGADELTPSARRLRLP